MDSKRDFKPNKILTSMKNQRELKEGVEMVCTLFLDMISGISPSSNFQIQTPLMK